MENVYSAAVIGSKIGSMILLLVIGTIGAIIPIYLKRLEMALLMCLCNAFAGGAFLALGMFHILPEALEGLETAGVMIYIGEGAYNPAYLLMFAGFILILFCESVLFNPQAQTIQQEPKGREKAPYSETETTQSSHEPSHRTRTPASENQTSSLDLPTVGTQSSSSLDLPIVGSQSYFSMDLPIVREHETVSRSWPPATCTVPQILDNEEKDLHVATEIDPPNLSSKVLMKRCANQFDQGRDNVSENGASWPEGSIATRHCEKGKIGWRSVFQSGGAVLLIALGVHGLFEGIVVGTGEDSLSVWMTALVISGHKWAESFALMTRFIDDQLSKQWVWCLLTTFLFSSPIGIAVGMAVVADGHCAAGVFNSLSVGTVFYVASEITMDVFAGGGGWRYYKFLAYILGAMVVLGLTLIEMIVE